MLQDELNQKLKEMGFVSQPDLPGSPDFGNSDAKLALCVFSRSLLDYLDERLKLVHDFHERFAVLRSKRWECRIIYREDSLEETVKRVNDALLRKATIKIILPPGPEPKHKKLIELLRQTDGELATEEQKIKRNYPVVWGLVERRRYIETRLHVLIKPSILKRDNNRCLACGSKENLELARLSGGDMARPEKINKKRTLWRYPDAEKRWAEENMLTLCEPCHKQLDSFIARIWRRKLGAISIQQAVELLQSGTLKELPPISPEVKNRVRQSIFCRSTITFLKVLRRAVLASRQNHPKRARMFLGDVKREWGYLCKRAEFPQDVEVKTEGLLAEMYLFGSTEELERDEQGVREVLMRHMEKTILPEIFSRFKDGLLSQDEKLSKLSVA
jgi:hypothetical protein